MAPRVITAMQRMKPRILKNQMRLQQPQPPHVCFCNILMEHIFIRLVLLRTRFLMNHLHRHLHFSLVESLWLMQNDYQIRLWQVRWVWDPYRFGFGKIDESLWVQLMLYDTKLKCRKETCLFTNNTKISNSNFLFLISVTLKRTLL